MSGHIPGPWAIRVDGLYLRIVHGEHKTTVASGIVSEANARLIAAAPFLLEALEALLEVQDHYVFSDDTLAQARAAIASARGEV